MKKYLALLIIGTTLVHSYEISDLYYMPLDGEAMLDMNAQTNNETVNYNLNNDEILSVSTFVNKSNVTFQKGINKKIALSVEASYTDTYAIYVKDEFDLFEDNSYAYGIDNPFLVGHYEFAKFGESVGARAYVGYSPEVFDAKYAQEDKNGTSASGGTASKIGLVIGSEKKNVQWKLDWNRISYDPSTQIGAKSSSDKVKYTSKSESNLDLAVRYDFKNNHFAGASYSFKTESEFVNSNNFLKEKNSEKSSTRLNIEYGYQKDKSDPYFYVIKGWQKTKPSDIEYVDYDFDVDIDEVKTNHFAIGIKHDF